MAPAATLTRQEEQIETVHQHEPPRSRLALHYEFHDACVIDKHAVDREIARYRAENDHERTK